MDAERLGAVLRAVRIRRGLRQSDVALLAGVSDATISRIERGHTAPISLGTLEAVARAVEIWIDLRPRSRGGDVDRLVNARHAALTEDFIATLSRTGWLVQPELSFSEFGERGSIDILAWHPSDRALLVVEMKTEIVDVGELLSTLDRKRRLAPRLALRRGWEAAAVSVALVVGESRTNRRRVIEHAQTIRAVLPADGRYLRRYLRLHVAPAAPLAALAFLPYRHGGTTRRGWSSIRRVRKPHPGPRRAHWRAGASLGQPSTRKARLTVPG